MPKKRKAPNFDLSLVQGEIPDGITNFQEKIRLGLHHFEEAYQKLYEETGNPLYAWEIIHMWFCPNALSGVSVLHSGIPL